MAIWHRRARLAAHFISAALRYWLSVYPYASREIYHWQQRAPTIPAPGLRKVAIENLQAERTNLEGAAAFAAFTQAALRAHVVRAQVAFQAAYDYADTLAEQLNTHPTANARRLHRSLLDAVTQGGGFDDYYAYHGETGDSGYLVALVDVARVSLLGLPSYEQVSRPIRRGAARIVDYQSRIGSPGRLSDWVKSKTPADADVAWWETAAACGSSMLVFALMARAAAPTIDPDEIACIERAYFPWIGALHTLLDSLVDRADDVAAGRQSLIDYYSSPQATVERLRLVTLEAKQRAEALPHSHDHTLILAAMMSSYLSSFPAADAGGRLTEAMGELAWPTRAVFWCKRLTARRRVRTPVAHLPFDTTSVAVSRPG